MKRLFILGAGASIDHSKGFLPSTRNFLVKARKIPELDFYHDLDEPEVIISSGGDSGNELEAYPRDPLSDESETTQRYLSRLYGIDVNNLGRTDPTAGLSSKDHKKALLIKRLEDVNIEELLTLVMIARQIDPSQPSEDHIINLIVQTINYYSQQIDHKNGAYNEFVEQLDCESDSIITFNWDTLLDKLFSENYAPPIRTTTGIIAYHSNFLEVCTAERENSFDSDRIKSPYIPDSILRENKATIPFGSHYIKLHGSINLVYCTNILCENYQKPLIRKGHLWQHNRCGPCHEALKLYIIPPIQNKPIRDMPYIRRSWNKAQELCMAAEQVVFWGYSLPPTDHWSNWLVRQIWAGKCKEIIVINPECFLNGKENESFINRFCPKDRFGNKQIERVAFNEFKEYLKTRED